MDSTSPWFAMALAPTLQPWALIAAGAATVVEAKLSSWQGFLALFLYCLLASASYLFLEIYTVFRPAQSQGSWAASGPGSTPTPTSSSSWGACSSASG